MPLPLATLLKRLLPSPSQLPRHLPAARRAAQPHPDEMSLLRRTSAVAVVVAVNKGVPPMQDRHVVDEVQVPGLCGDLELRGPRDGL